MNWKKKKKKKEKKKRAGIVMKDNVAFVGDELRI